MSGMRLAVGVIVAVFVTVVTGQQSVCFRPPETGNCRAHLPSFYYNPQIRQCDCFVFGGCNPGGNLFDTVESCMQTCAVPPSSQGVTSECARLFGSGGGRGGNSAGSFRGGSGNGGGVSQNTFQQEASSPRRPAGCLVSPETGTCRAFIPTYYFNPQTGSCDCFAFGGCRPNSNNFASVGECMQTCQVAPSDQFLSNECIRLFGNQQPSTPGQQPGQGQIGSQIDPEFIRQNQVTQNLGNQNLGNQNLGNQNFGNQNLGSQNLGNQNLGNQNLGSQNLGNQNFGPEVSATPQPFIPPPTTFAPRRQTPEPVQEAPQGTITRLTPVSSVFFTPSGTQSGQLMIGQPVRITG